MTGGVGGGGGGRGGEGSSVFVQKTNSSFLYFYILEMDESLDLSGIIKCHFSRKGLQRKTFCSRLY